MISLVIIFLIYLSSVIETIHYVIGTVIVFTAIFYAVVSISISMFIDYVEKSKEQSRPYQIASKYKKYIFTTIACLLVVGTFTPKKETYIAMIGVYMGQEILSNPKSLELFDKAYKAIDVSLDEIINSKKEGK